jgi:hypothetical protein
MIPMSQGSKTGYPLIRAAAMIVTSHNTQFIGQFQVIQMFQFLTSDSLKTNEEVKNAKRRDRVSYCRKGNRIFTLYILLTCGSAAESQQYKHSNGSIMDEILLSIFRMLNKSW